MTTGLSAVRYAGGWGLLIAMVVPLAVAAVRVRRHLAPGVEAPTARLVELTLVVAGAILIAEILGLVGAFSRGPVVAGCLAVGVGASLGAGSAATRPMRVTAGPLAVVTLVVVTIVIARWSAGTLVSIAQGIIDSDSQTYHLPNAARFVQDHSLTHLNFATVDDAVPYHPLNGEVLHAYGMLAFGRDLVSPFLNLLWLVAAVVAAWVVGEHRGRGLLAATTVSAFLATRLMWETQGGSARTDIVAACLLLGAVAMTLEAASSRVPLWLAGLAAGLAAGSKLSVIVPVIAVTIVAFATLRSRGRLGLAGAWIGAMVAGGGFWYARNLVAVGNPVPAMALRLGGVGLPRPPMRLVDRYGSSVADYLFDGKVWRSFFLPGLSDAFGPLWPLVVIGPLAISAAVILVGRSWLVRGLGVTVLVSFAAYLVTPTTALGPRGQPVLFGANLRYLAPALVLGLALAPIVATTRKLEWAGAALALAVVVSTVRVGWSANVVASVAIGVIIAAGAVLAVAGLPLRRSALRPASAAAAAAALVVGAGFLVQRDHLRDRYTSPDYRAATNRAAFAWAQSVHGAKIGTSGFFLNYPLYGSDLSNEVRYIGVHRRDGAFVDAGRCSTWKQLVDDGGFDYVVTMPPFPDSPEPPMAAWAASDDAAVEILRSGKEAVFELRGRMDPGSCP